MFFIIFGCNDPMVIMYDPKKEFCIRVFINLTCRFFGTLLLNLNVKLLAKANAELGHEQLVTA